MKERQKKDEDKKGDVSSYLINLGTIDYWGN
jgi:hypothetical protein